jgi:ABC-type antimicrobial peptide transport system permease subunit
MICQLGGAGTRRGVPEPMVLLAIAIVLAMVALAACFMPALHATRVNPAIALSE